MVGSYKHLLTYTFTFFVLRVCVRDTGAIGPLSLLSSQISKKDQMKQNLTFKETIRQQSPEDSKFWAKYVRKLFQILFPPMRHWKTGIEMKARPNLQLASFAKNDALGHRLFVEWGSLDWGLPLHNVIGKGEGSNSSPCPWWPSFKLTVWVTEVS